MFLAEGMGHDACRKAAQGAVALSLATILEEATDAGMKSQADAGHEGSRTITWLVTQLIPTGTTTSTKTPCRPKLSALDRPGHCLPSMLEGPAAGQEWCATSSSAAAGRTWLTTWMMQRALMMMMARLSFPRSISVRAERRPGSTPVMSAGSQRELVG
ncbi:hypothetical protein HaLaN_08249 [Haematococcus lacustris]|uniref:Uncharacterized protein n=1 Tax=Haematococcus lacustris TaxID=44745 RepID=A0A699YRR4_HAELA|nr:hypothetical protein HaLaN_08249 [Haematococcus lacustris]